MVPHSLQLAGRSFCIISMLSTRMLALRTHQPVTALAESGGEWSVQLSLHGDGGCCDPKEEALERSNTGQTCSQGTPVGFQNPHHFFLYC